MHACPGGRYGARVIDVAGLTKRYGPTVAVDGLSFTARPGRVTGFLGPNGSGKTTTLRVLLGLVHPDAGSATVGGVAYRDLPDPMRAVGALLEAAASFHPGRSGRDHLRVLCDAAGFPHTRADEVLAHLGLTDAGGNRVGGYSLGMRQRLGVAAALLGDPRVLVLDEPANGLDPAGIRWLRELLRSLAAQGRTVLVSSHVLAEVAQTVDDVVVIARGRLVAAGPLHEALAGRRGAVQVRTPNTDRLVAALADAGLPHAMEDGCVMVEGADAARVGDLCFAAGVPLHHLSTVEEALEDVFLRLVAA